MRSSTPTATGSPRAPARRCWRSTATSTSTCVCCPISLTRNYGTIWRRSACRCCPTGSAAHSGWLEACFDLGTAVIAPSCGFYGQQQPCGVFGYTVDAFDADSLEAAVRAEHARWLCGTAAPRAKWGTRRTQRVDLAHAHRDLYERVLS